MTLTPTWQRVYGPDDNYRVCGDDAVFEIGSVYGFGTPNGDEPRCEWECEVVYYVEEVTEEYGRPRTRAWIVSEMTHSYRNVGDDSTADEYDYEGGGCALFHDTLKAATDCARRLSTEDESWKLSHWNPELSNATHDKRKET